MGKHQLLLAGKLRVPSEPLGPAGKLIKARAVDNNFVCSVTFRIGSSRYVITSIIDRAFPI